MEAHALCSDNRNRQRQFPAITREQWTGLIQSKKDFYDNKIDDLHNCPYLSPEIADSWLRSRNAHVDPYNPLSNKTLSKTALREYREQNSAAIKLAAPLFKSFHMARHCSDFHFLLLDKNGVILLQEGLLFKNMARKSKTILSEDQLGTNAHVICNTLKRPVQLFGPQHYNYFLEKIVVMAAPIFDEHGEIAYDVVLSLPLILLPWEEHYHDVYTPIFSLVMSIAISIETKIKQQKSYEYMQLLNDHFRSLIKIHEKNIDDKEVITIENSGIIIESSIESHKIISKNILSFMRSKTTIMDSVRQGRHAHTSNTFDFGESEEPYFIDIHPVKNKWSQQIIGAVLTLNSTGKAGSRREVRQNKTASFRTLIGDSPSFLKAVNIGQAFSCSSDNILLTGESGTGKELFAQAIHANCCPDGPFIAINCAAMPRELIESELFGYERGSFTGADRCGRPGKIELAEGGTLFLDEIGDMNLELQAVLLRVLQDKQVVRVGGRHPKTVNFRLIAATNRNLSEQVENHLFREDLFYRLSVLTINLPPLRDRESDIPLLCRHFVESYCNKKGMHSPQISPLAQQRLNSYKWPGNIRQLENAIIYAINSAQGRQIIDLRNLPEALILEDLRNASPGVTKQSEPSGKAQTIQDSEKNTIQLALADAQYNVLRAAGILKISKSTLYRKIKKYGIQF